MYYEFSNYSEEEYLEEYEFRNDPAQWKEHYPWDDGYVPYVFSIDSGFQLKEKLIEYLSLGGLSYYEQERAKYLLRAVERDIRQMKIGHNNERSK